jgi:putative transposase
VERHLRGNIQMNPASRRDASTATFDSTTAMSTYPSLHYHLVYSTKNREPTIDAAWRSRLHEYLGGTVNGLEGQTEGVGGTSDHVHLLVSLKSTHCLADFMRDLKKATSVWVHEKVGQAALAWQEGYGGFTVSPTARDSVRKYIANQEEHHRTLSFRDELVQFLEKAGVEYDSKYFD